VTPWWRARRRAARMANRCRISHAPQSTECAIRASPAAGTAGAPRVTGGRVPRRKGVHRLHGLVVTDEIAPPLPPLPACSCSTDAATTTSCTRSWSTRQPSGRDEVEDEAGVVAKRRRVLSARPGSRAASSCRGRRARGGALPGRRLQRRAARVRALPRRGGSRPRRRRASDFCLGGRPSSASSNNFSTPSIAVSSRSSTPTPPRTRRSSCGRDRDFFERPVELHAAHRDCMVCCGSFMGSIPRAGLLAPPPLAMTIRQAAAFFGGPARVHPCSLARRNRQPPAGSSSRTTLDAPAVLTALRSRCQRRGNRSRRCPRALADRSAEQPIAKRGISTRLTRPVSGILRRASRRTDAAREATGKYSRRPAAGNPDTGCARELG